jgi:hypothetical protein
MKKSIEIIISDNPKTHQDKIGNRFCSGLTHFIFPIPVNSGFQSATHLNIAFFFVTIIEYNEE